MAWRLIEIKATSLWTSERQLTANRKRPMRSYPTGLLAVALACLLLAACHRTLPPHVTPPTVSEPPANASGAPAVAKSSPVNPRN
jgi:hypothetical protein